MSKYANKYHAGIVIRTLIIFEVLLAAGLVGMYVVIKTVKESFQFGKPEMLYALAGMTVLSIIFALVISWKNLALQKFADNALLKHLVPDISTGFTTFKFLLFRLGIAFVVIGLSMPQYGINEVEAKSQGIDLVIAVDVSKSMNAEDLKPNRIERAKLAIQKLLKSLKGDRVGVITFAGISDVHVPITNDYKAIKSFLTSINTEFPVQGTAIGSAIELALTSFNMKNGSQKAIVVITDGENHEDDATGAAKKAKDLGILVHTIGMGSLEGVPIPVYNRGRQVGFKQDGNGQTVVTKLNENMLKEIAQAGGGAYIRASESQVGLNLIVDEINKMEATEFGSIVFQDYEDQFPIYLMLGMALLILELFLSEKKSSWKTNVKLFEE